MNNDVNIASERQQMAAMRPNYGDDAERDALVNPDLVDLITILFAETVGGYERLQDEEGTLRWRKREYEGAQIIYRPMITAEQLPPVAKTGFQLCGFIDAFCAQVNTIAAQRGIEDRLCWSIQRTARPHPEGSGAAVYASTFAELHDGEMVPGRTVYVDDPALAMAQALLYAKQVNFYEAHRALFPQRYLSFGGTA